jgi:hypothetical protein
MSKAVTTLPLSAADCMLSKAAPFLSLIWITLQAVTNAAKNVAKRIEHDNKFAPEVIRLKEHLAADK